MKLVVVSNANGTLQAHMRRVGLAPHFDVVIDSHDEGVEKPDPRLFQIALERAGARPESTVHVGDIYQMDVRRGACRRDCARLLLDETGLASRTLTATAWRPWRS